MLGTMMAAGCSSSRQCFWFGAGEQPSAADVDPGYGGGSHTAKQED